jgi:hypothetical protein
MMAAHYDCTCADEPLTVDPQFVPFYRAIKRVWGETNCK